MREFDSFRNAVDKYAAERNVHARAHAEIHEVMDAFRVRLRAVCTATLVVDAEDVARDWKATAQRCVDDAYAMTIEEMRKVVREYDAKQDKKLHEAMSDMQRNHRVTGHSAGCHSFNAQPGACSCPPEEIS